MDRPGHDTSAPAGATALPARGGFRIDRGEIAGAFGDLGTLIPFLAAYLAIVKLDPCAVFGKLRPEEDPCPTPRC
ncbi:MAG: hypothetical protein ACREVS_13930 [Burkholderiales bacterium]